MFYDLEKYYFMITDLGGAYLKIEKEMRYGFIYTKFYKDM